MKTSRIITLLKDWTASRVVNVWIQDVLGLCVRLLFGWLLLQTGLGKLSNLGRTAAYFATLHLPAPQATALLIGGAECLGGVLLGIGLLARPAAFFLACTLTGALLTAHRSDVLEGLDSLVATTPFPYLLAVLWVLAYGAGRFSLDHLGLRRRAGP